MGPIEVFFLVVIGLFGAIGIVRGYQRDLGVTTMLLLALFVLTFIPDYLGDQLASVMTTLGVSQSSAETVYAIFATVLLCIVAFISYHGVGLLFPGSGRNWFVSLLVGLLNGYLFAGSIWWYLNDAGWPLDTVVETYSSTYQFLIQLMPPAIFSWPYFILLAVGMLILRVVR
ncbi:MAG: hypothetical protein U9R25_06950 [Chloroflexota bacterium]|nr:hypothetical protein [Chloroflexota bacterium]